MAMMEWEEAKARLEEKQARARALHAVAIQIEAADLDAALQRVEELEGESRVLIGCPCWCHAGDGPEPHGDCRECVRGTATPAAIERDHTEALWREKWTAALDLMGSQAERADAAEAEAKLQQQAGQVHLAEVRRLDGLLAEIARGALGEGASVNRGLNSVQAVLRYFMPEVPWTEERLEERIREREGRDGS